MKFLRIFSRVLLGLVFIFSGYVKAIDPIGSQLIFTANFEAFGWGFMIPLALFFSILLSAAELALGLCLLMGLRMVLTAWATVAFMGFFTVFTLVLAIFNPVSDCGCFGEAIKMTNWETFYKNVILDIFVVIVVWQRKHYRPLSNCRNEIITGAAFAVFSVLLSVYCLRHLPLTDFLPYKVGVNIQRDMEIPEDAPRDEYYSTVLLLDTKDGVIKEFPADNYPWSDTTYVWQDTKTVLVKKGYVPPIIDFSINSRNWEAPEDFTEYILNLPGHLFILTLPHAEKASLRNISKINAIYDCVVDNECVHFIALSGSDDGNVERFIEQTNARYPVYFTDEKPLKSMIRANPGLMLLHNGTIVAKWSHIDIPSVKKLESKYLSEIPDVLIVRHQTKARFTSQLLVVALFLVMIMLSYCFRKYCCKKEDDADSRTLSA